MKINNKPVLFVKADLKEALEICDVVNTSHKKMLGSEFKEKDRISFPKIKDILFDRNSYLYIGKVDNKIRG